MESNIEPKQSRAIGLLKRIPGGEQVIKESPKSVVSTPSAPSVPVPNNVAPTPPEPPKVVEATAVKEPEFDINPTKPAADKIELNKEPIPKEFLPEDPTDEIDQLMEPNESIGKNFKNLRTRLKSVNKLSKEQGVELEALRKKVTDYENGLAVPEITAQQTARIEELERFEKIVNFKSSPVYQEKYINPIKAEEEKLAQLATEYSIDPKNLEAAMSATTAADANRILTQLFKDDIGALEAKSIIKNINKIRSDAQEAEKEPAQIYAKMQEESNRIIQEKRARANEAIAHVSKDAWSESLQHLRTDPRFPEITYKEGDTEHNDRYVRPILTKAGQEYGKIIRTLAENGLSELPKDLSVALARMTQLAHQSAAIAVQRDSLSKRVQELEDIINRKNMINRPGVNSTSGNGTVSSGSTSKAVGAANAGRNVLNRVMGKA